MADGHVVGSALFPITYGQPLSPFNSGAWAQLQAIPTQSERDVLLLGYVSSVMIEGVGLETWVTLWPDVLWEAVLDALERNGLASQKAILERIAAGMPGWEDGPESRTMQLLALFQSDTEETRLLSDWVLAQLTAFQAAEPSIAQAVQMILAADADFAARFDERRRLVPETEKLSWLEYSIMACLNEQPWQAGTPFPFDALVETRRDVLMLTMINTYLNLGMLGFYYKPVDPSFSTVLPFAAEALERAGLAEDAAILRDALAEPDPSAGVLKLQALNGARIQRRTVDLAKEANLWPQ
ncbi:hypothetical protein [Pacificoceanicola onchidii]|uniref:hypothetical protein n=1 Tax=Pacificoceanicola onchidii TaxID=2562685 RepID=UPI0010A4CDA2|nr:hypothetical protein [Pacificoceanicola onchidii]